MRYIFILLNLFLICSVNAKDLDTDKKAEQLNLSGEKYHFARGVTQDFSKAKEYYLQAVELGSAVAANHLGRLYLNGEGVEKNNEQAEKWYKRSAELDPSIENKCINDQYPNRLACAIVLAAMENSAPAEYELGALYESGETELGQDLDKAFQLYLKAAEKEHIGAIIAIINCYKNGIGTIQNHNKAKEWEQKKIEFEKKVGEVF